MTKPLVHTKQIYNWLLVIIRSLIGITVIKVGYEVAVNKQHFGYYQDNGFFTGLFVIAVGCYFILFSFFK